MIIIIEHTNVNELILILIIKRIIIIESLTRMNIATCLISTKRSVKQCI